MSRRYPGLRLSEIADGDKVVSVSLYGDKRSPEPDHFRVHLPGGADVDICRTTDGNYDEVKP